MTATTLPTPADLSITPRDRRFGRDSATPRLWHGGRVEATAIYNALSSTFPIGEAYFVESVRAFREGTPAKLAEEIKAFTTQEVIHSREHDAFNQRAADAGYDLSKLEARVEERLAVARARGPFANCRGDHGARAFHRDPRPPAARRPAASRRRRVRRPPSCGAGMRARRSSTRASPTTPGCGRPATGRASSAGRSRPRSCSTSPATSSSTGRTARSS